MRVFISVDMEGVAGVAAAHDCEPGHREYERSRLLMTDEASAAVAGAVAGGATEVVVNDSHDGMTNLLPERLDRRARLLRGRHKPWGMVQGLDGSFACALFVGYHARAGTPDAVLAHTMSGPSLQDVRLNGSPAGEILLNASYAAHHRVPVVLVTGDAATAREATADVPGVRTAVVKEAAGTFAASSMHPEEACALIRREAEAAVGGAGSAAPLARSDSYRLEVRFRSVAVAQGCLRLPGSSLLDPRTVAYTAPTMPVAYGVLQLLLDEMTLLGDEHGYA